MGGASSAVFNIKYYIVGSGDQCCRGYKILEERVTLDHIHLFIEADPFNSPVKVFKGVGSLRLEVFRAGEEGDVLWPPSYYMGTAGQVSAEAIQNYIKAQERHSSTD